MTLCTPTLIGGKGQKHKLAKARQNMKIMGDTDFLLCIFCTKKFSGKKCR